MSGAPNVWDTIFASKKPSFNFLLRLSQCLHKAKFLFLGIIYVLIWINICRFVFHFNFWKMFLFIFNQYLFIQNLIGKPIPQLKQVNVIDDCCTNRYCYPHFRSKMISTFFTEFKCFVEKKTLINLIFFSNSQFFIVVAIFENMLTHSFMDNNSGI